MGDRTAHTAEIKIKERCRQALLETLSDGADTAEIEENEIRLVFTDTSVGFSEELADRIEELAQEYNARVAYRVWQDPVYEYLGVLYVLAPGFSRFTQNCDSTGCVVLPYDAIKSGVNSLNPVEGIRVAFGYYQESAYEEFDPDR